MKRAWLMSCAVVVSSVLVVLGQEQVEKRAKKPAMVTTKEWGSDPAPIDESRKHVPKWVTIHHAGETWWNDKDPAKFVKAMQEWGKKRPQIEKPPRDTFWPDVPYHFLIAPDGRIFEGRPVQYEPDTNTRYKVAGNIGVELMGNFNVQRPSKEQVESCVKITAWLCQEYNIDVEHIRTHRDAAPGQTDCPGRDFYRYMLDGKFRKWVLQAMDGKEPEIELGEPLGVEKAGPTTLITDFHRAPAAAKNDGQ